MTRPTRRLTRGLTTILAATLCLVTVANGQARPEERNRPPLVTLVETGEGVPVLLRWRSSSRTDRTIIVTSRTGTTMVPRPEADGEGRDVEDEGRERDERRQVRRKEEGHGARGQRHAHERRQQQRPPARAVHEHARQRRHAHLDGHDDAAAEVAVRHARGP